MRFLVQRVTQASVEVENQVIGSIGKGYLVFVGITGTDTEAIADKMVKKLIGLRIFEDENGKTNLDIKTVDGQMLLISQFTLYADCKKGNRPSFIKAGAPDRAKALYEYAVERCRLHADKVEQGVFGADMEVELVNDGPFTLMLDSRELLGDRSV